MGIAHQAPYTHPRTALINPIIAHMGDKAPATSLRDHNMRPSWVTFNRMNSRRLIASDKPERMVARIMISISLFDNCEVVDPVHELGPAVSTRFMEIRFKPKSRIFTRTPCRAAW